LRHSFLSSSPERLSDLNRVSEFAIAHCHCHVFGWFGWFGWVRTYPHFAKRERERERGVAVSLARNTDKAL
jgi:hypothetical protein